MEERLKQRLVGAVVLVSLAVVFVPILFDLPGDVNRETSTPPISEIPERPQGRSGSPVSVTLDPPQTRRLDAEVERERSMSEAGADGGASPAAVEAATAATAAGTAASAATPEPSEPAASATRIDPSPARSDTATATATGRPADGSERKRAAQVPGAGGWTVQLGSFLRPENARALRKRLQDKGYPAFVESGPSSQGAVSRVFVGPMAERSQAKESAVKLRREMALDGIVVPYPGG